MEELLAPLDEDALARTFRAATPFRFLCIDGLLQPDFAREVAHAYPSYREARGTAREFRAVHESLKLQVTDPARFPEPVRRLHELLASRLFRDRLTRITGIPDLLEDPELTGGGMHIMGTGGRLDVHVDFNVLQRGERLWHRRLNVLVYLNETWDPAWGGCTDLWDERMKDRAALLAPMANRCIVFNTCGHSWHGVTPLRCPPHVTRNSFASYYYTEQAPADWDGAAHDTVFRTRPGEWWRGHVLAPAERAINRLTGRLRRVSRRLAS